jgi:hypothetical protein
MPEDPERDGAEHRGEDPDDESLYAGFRGMSDAVRRAVRAGVKSVLSEDGFRGVVLDALPREIASYVTRQADLAKDEVVRVVGQQIKKFLENLDVGGELKKILTSLSFEIKTEIRFVPSDESVIKPDAKVRVRVKQAGGADKTVTAGVSALRDAVAAGVEGMLSRLGREGRAKAQPDPDPATEEAGSDG